MVGIISAPPREAHRSLSPPSGQSYEVQMLCNPKLGDATQGPQLLKVGTPPPRTGKGWVSMTVPLGRKPVSSL